MSQPGSQDRGRGGRGRGGGGRGGGGWGRGAWRGRGGGRGWGWRGGRGGWQNRGGGTGGAQGRSTPSNSQVVVIPTVVEQATPYKGWLLYFPGEVYSDQSMLTRRIEVFQKYLLSWKAIFNLNDIEAKGFFSIDCKELVIDQVIQDSLPELYKEIREMPLTIVNALGLAMHQMIHAALQREAIEGEEGEGGGPPPYVEVRRIYCRLYNFEPVTPLKKLKANFYGKFVSVKGTVVRVSNIKPLCTQMAFECSGCGTIQAVQLPDGKYVMPTKCPGDGCRSRTFIPKRSHRLTETIDWQVVRIQEIINDDHRESGRIPRTVDCELTNDLVDSCVPGDIVTVAGDVKVMGTQEGRGRQKDKCMFLLYINANSVTNAKGNKSSSGAEGGEPGSGVAMEFSLKELYAIQEIQSEPHLFRLIVGSLCPTIYGHELVKAGLVLGLFGGSQKYANDKNRIPVRGDPHVLVVGDPGLGKSQMLQAVSNVAPRSVYVCGNTTTTSGLTVTMSKEGGGGGDFALEAGALVLADQGCCCIDEFDKMGNQHQALLEAMEQQSISIAKAGVVCSLPARTSIIAAANPVGGHYNKAKTVSENLRMGSALLSRFDLVFILLDKPDEEMDAMLSEHVMALHAGRKRVSTTGSAMTTPRSDADDESRLQWEQDKPLSERLKLPRWEPFDPLPPQLLRKYVGYARKYVHPKIGPEAAQVLQSFYLDLRKKHQTQDSTPITTRQLESLIRLTEARARLELREEATDQDARDVIETMKYSMVDTYMDEFGLLDFQRSQHGSGMSCRSQAKKMIAILQRTYNQTYNSLFTVQEMRQLAKDGGINVPNFEDFISSLNNQGFLLKKGPRMYQLQTAGY